MSKKVWDKIADSTGVIVGSLVIISALYLYILYDTVKRRK